MSLNTYFTEGLSYENYIEYTEDALEAEIEIDDPQELVQYYAINLQRMRRIHKTFKFSNAQKKRIEAIENNFKILIITEGWCGDASQIVPIVERLAEALKVECKFVLRDQHMDLMENYKTNNTISIPIIVGVDQEGEELFRFGPRPARGMEILTKFKENPDRYSKEEFHEDLQRYYNENKGEDTVNELLDLIDESK